MRAVLGSLGLVLVLAASSAGTANANPALLAARAAQIASKASQASRMLGRMSKISRMAKMAQRARKGMGAFKSPGSLGRMRVKMRRSMTQRRFDKFRQGGVNRFNSMRRVMAKRLNEAHGPRTLAQRMQKMKPMRSMMERRTQMSRMWQHRTQRRSTAAQNHQQSDAHRARMRRASEMARRSTASLHRSGGQDRHRGMFATAMSR